MKTVPIPLDVRSYDVMVGTGLLASQEVLKQIRARLPVTRAALLSDASVGPLYGDALADAYRRLGVEVSIHRLEKGEAGKSIETFARVQGELIDEGLDRKSFLIALGGGAIGDATGFVASTFMRGIPFVQYPTTLLAMVDASVGGKTAVNLPQGKNLVGTFHQPSAVVADLSTLESLPRRELVSGLAEVIKYGLMHDESLLRKLEGHSVDELDMEEVVTRSVEIKAHYVCRDERESGLREHLNLGHTFAHGIEAATSYGRYLHGEAVGIGLRAACSLGERVLGLSTEVRERLDRVLDAFELPKVTDLSADAILTHMRTDKKKRDGELRFVLPRAIGDLDVVPSPEEAKVREALSLIT